MIGNPSSGQVVRSAARGDDSLPSWKGFGRFAALEVGIGGPDPHIELIGAHAQSLESFSDRLWLAGCFVMPYTIGTAALIFDAFPTTYVQELLRNGHLESDLEHFLTERWSRVWCRNERRVVRRADKLARCLAEYAQWCFTPGAHPRGDDYESLYRSVQTIWSISRYGAMKLLFTLNRAGVITAEQPDIRPRGGWSPRRTLGLLHEPLAGLEKSNKQSVLALTEQQSWRAKSIAEDACGKELSWCQVETLLCNYRQALKGRYPGRSHDNDRAYWERAFPLGGSSLPFYDLRMQLFPVQCLGEVQGWDKRPELGDVIKDYGYMWCDTVYNYTATTNLEEPVRR